MKSSPVREAGKRTSVDARRALTHGRAPGLPGRAAALGALHRTHGNRLVQRLLDTAVSHRDSAAPTRVQHAIDRTRGGGQAMQPDVRRNMESAFGADFGGVRLHTNAGADSLNRALSARAFTTGRDIYFRHGEYDPDKPVGRRLLAHELTHVVQQAGGAERSTLVVGAPDDAYEREADRAAETVTHSPAHGSSANTSLAAGEATGSIQRTCAACAAAARNTDREEQEGNVSACAHGCHGVVPRKIQRQPQSQPQRLPPGTHPDVKLDPHSAEVAITQAIEALGDIKLRGKLTEPGNIITDVTGVPLGLPASTLDLSLAYDDRCNRSLQSFLVGVRQQQAAGRSVFDFSQADWTAFLNLGLRRGSTRADGSVELSFNGDRVQSLVFTLTFTPGVSEKIPEECRRRPDTPDTPSGGGDTGGLCAGIDCGRPATFRNMALHALCCLRPPERTTPDTETITPTPMGLPPRTLYFFYDTAVMKPGSNDTLDQIFDALDLFPTLRVHITGHTSLEGTESYNERLSRSRAEAARDLLALRGIASSRIRVLPMGEHAPAVVEPPEPAPRSLRLPRGEAIRDLNRRAEIVFFDPTGTVRGVPVMPAMTLTLPSSLPRQFTTRRLGGFGLSPLTL